MYIHCSSTCVCVYIPGEAGLITTADTWQFTWKRLRNNNESTHECNIQYVYTHMYTYSSNSVYYVNKYIHTISQWFAVQVANTFNTFNATTYA